MTGRPDIPLWILIYNELTVVRDNLQRDYSAYQKKAAADIEGLNIQIGDWNTKYNNFEEDHKKSIADWEKRYADLELKYRNMNSDWESKYGQYRART